MHHLAAGAAGRTHVSRKAGDRDGRDACTVPMLTDSAENGVALSATRQPKGEIFDVASGYGSAIVPEQRSAYREL